MKMTKFARILGFVVALVLIATPVTAFASQPPAGAEITDIYNSWAEFDILMASTVYGLGNEGTYSNFRGRLLTEKFAPVYESLAEALGSSAELGLEPDSLVTRGQVVAALYALLSDESATAEEAAEYFVSKGLMNGRAPGDYQLEAVCTVQEMIVLAVRAYEHAARLAGNASVGFLWEIKGANNTVYLLGSIHLGDNAIYPLSEKIMSAFDNSANLVVEVDIAGLSEEEMTYIQAMQLVDFENGETIADYLSEETFELFSALVEALELPEEFYYLKPWAAHLALSVMFMSTGDAEESAAMGIDMLLLMKAYSMNKQIKELESSVFQIEMLASFSRELQELQLQALLLTILGDPDEPADADDLTNAELQAVMEIMLSAIKAGDDEVFGEMMAASRAADGDDPLSLEYSNAMWAHRDVGMAQGIAGFLESETNDGDYFVVVGAGHLFGDGCVIFLLTEMGYDVVRVR